MKIRHNLAAAAAAVVLATVASACADTGEGRGAHPAGGGEPSSSVPLLETDWYRRNFGTPLMAANTQLRPRAIEQAHDQRGVALPQNRAQLDGPVMWQRIRCEALPFTTGDGPTRLRGDTIYGGFAHTELGAALAAFHLRNFGGTAADLDAIPTIAAPPERANIVPQLRLNETKIPAREPDCLATTRKNGIRRPARWHAEQVGSEVYNVQYWYPPEPGADGRGYSTDVTVVWSGDDWYLTAQSIGEIGYSGQQKQPVASDEPTGWPRW
ncbi:hypothetical protein [Nocardia abscessus]|uniref:hypothetical protein n=1 Tax=Nocardia abscessus TaxID=120957 RepID=UPI00245560E7|nr:hypothetical protein [Nocardia abscessus]